MEDQTLKSRIQEKVLECVNLLNSRFPNHEPFPMPKVYFQIDSIRVMGTASWKNWSLDFNLKFASVPENTERFLSKTIPHEVAHLADFYYYKGWGHKRTWKNIMIYVFRLEPDRCADDVKMPSDVKPRNKRTFAYSCSCPGHIIPVSARMHNSIQVKGNNRICVKCKTRITLTSINTPKEVSA